MVLSSQELEPPPNPGRLTSQKDIIMAVESIKTTVGNIPCQPSNKNRFCVDCDIPAKKMHHSPLADYGWQPHSRDGFVHQTDSAVFLRFSTGF
jgi:hypothetical protein